MSRFFDRRLTPLLVVVVLLSGRDVIRGQSQDLDRQPNETSASRNVSRMPDGKPNLQGVWSFTSGVPLERPTEWAGKHELTEAEAAEFTRRQGETRKKREESGIENKTGYDLDVWFEDGRNQRAYRTSLIVDPPDGRLPALTPAAKRRISEGRQAAQEAAGPEDKTLADRCILGFNAGPPMMPSAYNNYVHILQARDVVVMQTEMIHDARIVPLDGRPFIGFRQWAGVSRGRWEGDTLVVETRYLLEKTGRSSSSAPGFSWHRNVEDRGSEKLRVTERFTRVDASTLLYEFTVDDPDT